MKRILFANIFGIISSVLIGTVSFTFTRFSYYSHPLMVLPTFGLPCIAAIIFSHHYFHSNLYSHIDNKLSSKQLESYLIAADALWWYIILIFISIFLVGLTPVALYWCLGFFIILHLRVTLLNKLQRKYFYIYDIFHCTTLILPVIVAHLLSKKVLGVFIPIMVLSMH